MNCYFDKDKKSNDYLYCKKDKTIKFESITVRD